MADLLLPPPPRRCQHVGLPEPDEHVLPLGSLARCRACGRWFVHVDCYAGGWSQLSKWTPVRWWRFRSRRRIATRSDMFCSVCGMPHHHALAARTQTEGDKS